MLAFGIVFDHLVGIVEKTQDRSWRMCDKPGTEKDIHTTEDDGWQIVDEYGEKTPPKRSPMTSPEREPDALDSNVFRATSTSPCTDLLAREDHCKLLQRESGCTFPVPLIPEWSPS